MRREAWSARAVQLTSGIVAATAAPACGDNKPASPTGSTTTTTTFTVYNHTAGRLGSWTASLQSGTRVTLDITALGEVVDEDGNVGQAAIPVDSADSQRLVVRAVSSQVPIGERMS
jgi:hypothetical protein